MHQASDLFQGGLGQDCSAHMSIYLPGSGGVAISLQSHAVMSTMVMELQARYWRRGLSCEEYELILYMQFDSHHNPPRHAPLPCLLEMENDRRCFSKG